MDILHDEWDKRTIVLALDEHAEGSDLKNFLEQHYDVLVVDDGSECAALMIDRYAEISAVIIDIGVAEENDFAFFDAIDGKKGISTIPVIIATRRPIEDRDMECLYRGAFDIMSPPYYRELTICRIENAIRSKRSKTFVEIEKMLKELPSNIFLKDAQGRYVFQTHLWGHIETGDDPNWTIRGKTDMDIRKDKENAKKAMEADQEIIRTGVGTNYIIEENTAGKQEFLELIKRPVFDDDGHVTGIIALINDVTDKELMRRQLEKNATTDELTGLGNHRAFDEIMHMLPESDYFPVGVISADCDGLKVVNDTLGHVVGDQYIRLAAANFQLGLPDNAYVFRTGGDEFVAFIPNTTKEDAQALAEKMEYQNKFFHIEGCDVSVSYGADAVESADEKILDAVRRADKGMYDNKAARMKSRPSYYLNVDMAE